MSLENDRRAQIGLRYGPKDMDQYHRVRKIAEELKESLSGTGKLLIAKGIQHKDNPEPLVKEKVVYRDKVVPVEKVVEKLVYRDRPAVNHATEEHIRGADRNSQEGALSAKLTSGDKADSPSSSKGNTALGEKKADTQESGLGWLVLGAGIAGVVLYFWKRYST